MLSRIRFLLAAADCSEPPVHGGQPVPVLGVRGHARRARLLAGPGTKRPRRNHFTATDVAQTLSLPRPDSSGCVFERARQASR